MSYRLNRLMMKMMSRRMNLSHVREHACRSPTLHLAAAQRHRLHFLRPVACLQESPHKRKSQELQQDRRPEDRTILRLGHECREAAEDQPKNAAAAAHGRGHDRRPEKSPAPRPAAGQTQGHKRKSQELQQDRMPVDRRILRLGHECRQTQNHEAAEDQPKNAAAAAHGRGHDRRPVRWMRSQYQEQQVKNPFTWRC